MAVVLLCYNSVTVTLMVICAGAAHHRRAGRAHRDQWAPMPLDVKPLSAVFLIEM